MSFLFGGGDRDRDRDGGGAASERSEEERERARLEREARRAEREAAQAPAALRLEEPGVPDTADAEIRVSRGEGRAPADRPAAAEPRAPAEPPAHVEPPARVEPPVAGDAPPPAPEQATAPFDPVAHGSTAPFDPLAQDGHGAGNGSTAPFDSVAYDGHAGVNGSTAPFDPVAYDPDALPREPAGASPDLVYDPDALPREPAGASPDLVYDPDAPPASPAPHREPPPYAPEEDDVPSVVVRGRRDAPAGVRRVRASAVASAAGAAGPPRFGAPPRPPARPRRRRRRLLLLLLPLLALLLAAAWIAWQLFQPLGADEAGERVQVRIPEGLTAAQIGDLLEERGVVDSGFFFSLRTRLADDLGGLRSGTVELRRDMSYSAAMEELTKAPPAAPRTIKVTIPEGRSRREVGPIIREAGLRGSYAAATRRSRELDPRDYGAPRGASLEGFLFPATYDVRPNARTSQLVRQQLRAFEENFGEVDLSRARRAGLSRYDVLIIASMIEREATLPRERRLVSAVIYNRLRDGINLGIDATIRYALDQWSAPLKESELAADTPYNTRVNAGLPPGPIGSPGLASIKAAANPARSDALFYVVKPCGNGAHAFSSSDAQFQRDVAAYNRARDARGGKDPSRC